MPANNAGVSKDFVEQQRKRLETLRGQLQTGSAVAAERDRQNVTDNGVLGTADMGEIATERQTDQALNKVTNAS